MTATQLDPRVVPAGSIGAHGVKVLRVGLRMDDGLPWQSWKAIGAKVATHADAASWWLGDWLVFGESHYGSRYAEAIASSGLEYKTLRNYAVVARRFSLSRRRAALSFAHHAELCALSDEQQEVWLDRAKSSGWSRAQLRREIRDRDREAPRNPPSSVRVSADEQRAHRWRQAALLAGSGFDAWIVQTLDVAADHVLERTADASGPASR